MRLNPLLTLVCVCTSLTLTGCTEGGGEADNAAPGTAASASTTAGGTTPEAPIIQPGKPGEPNKTVTTEAVRPSSPPHQADVTFMQHMIVHHGQAITMVDIVDGKLTDPQVRALANRIKIEQKPEMGYMSRWLTQRGKPTASPKPSETDSASESGHGGHGDHGSAPSAGDPNPHTGMVGMATPAQLAGLRAAMGAEVDKTFLSLMITHHRGALIMVVDRSKDGGTDQDAEKLGADIHSAQSVQIGKMASMLKRLGGTVPPEPR